MTTEKTPNTKTTHTAYEEWGVAPDIWLLMWGTACCACGGTDVSGLLVWIYCIGIACDEGTGWLGWIGLGANCCIGCEYCSCWPWTTGIPIFEGIACPACPNCCEVIETYGCPCCAWMTGRNCKWRRESDCKILESKIK